MQDVRGIDSPDQLDLGSEIKI